MNIFKRSSNLFTNYNILVYDIMFSRHIKEQEISLFKTNKKKSYNHLSVYRNINMNKIKYIRFTLNNKLYNKYKDDVFTDLLEYCTDNYMIRKTILEDKSCIEITIPIEGFQESLLETDKDKEFNLRHLCEICSFNHVEILDKKYRRLAGCL